MGFSAKLSLLRDRYIQEKILPLPALLCKDPLITATNQSYPKHPMPTITKLLLALAALLLASCVTRETACELHNQPLVEKSGSTSNPNILVHYDHLSETFSYHFDEDFYPYAKPIYISEKKFPNTQTPETYLFCSTCQKEKEDAFSKFVDMSKQERKEFIANHSKKKP